MRSPVVHTSPSSSDASTEVGTSEEGDVSAWSGGKPGGRREPDRRSDDGSARAEPAERGDVLLHRIPLVASQAVAGVLGVELHHPRITRRLGEDRRGRDREAARVAFDDALLRDVEILQVVARR